MKKFTIVVASLVGMSFVYGSVFAAPARVKTSRAAPVSAPATIVTGESASDFQSFDHGTGFEIKPIVGYAFINPKALNSVLADQAEFYKVNNTYKLGGAPFYGAQVQYFFTPNFGAGLSFDYMTSSTDAVVIGTAPVKATAQSTLTVAPLMAIASYKAQIASQFSLGGTFGAGFPVSYNYAYKISGSSIPGLRNGDRSYSATPFIWALGAQGTYHFTQMFGVQLNAGYRNIVSSQFRADEAFSDEFKESDLLQDADKANIKIDASSFVTSFGVVINL
jgi:hypothetical protein